MNRFIPVNPRIREISLVITQPVNRLATKTSVINLVNTVTFDLSKVTPLYNKLGLFPLIKTTQYNARLNINETITRIDSLLFIMPLLSYNTY